MMTRESKDPYGATRECQNQGEDSDESFDIFESAGKTKSHRRSSSEFAPSDPE